jgi:hypothetical protein
LLRSTFAADSVAARSALMPLPPPDAEAAEEEEDEAEAAEEALGLGVDVPLALDAPIRLRLVRMPNAEPAAAAEEVEEDVMPPAEAEVCAEEAVSSSGTNRVEEPVECDGGLAAVKTGDTEPEDGAVEVERAEAAASACATPRNEPGACTAEALSGSGPVASASSPQSSSDSTNARGTAITAAATPEPGATDVSEGAFIVRSLDEAGREEAEDAEGTEGAVEPLAVGSKANADA